MLMRKGVSVIDLTPFFFHILLFRANLCSSEKVIDSYGPFLILLSVSYSTYLLIPIKSNNCMLYILIDGAITRFSSLAEYLMHLRNA
jgi:hypothetical protein